MNAKPFVKALYFLNGLVFAIVATAVLLFRTPLLPDGIRDIILKTARGDLNAVHLLQEFSSLMAGVAVISFWAFRHYEQRRIYHIAMTLFWGLLALIHWFDVRGPFHSFHGPVINSIPFVLFLLAGIVGRD